MIQASIPVLTLWEPWASLIVAGFKRHETRHWPTLRRQTIAVHAAQRVERDVDPALDELCAWAFGADWRRTRPTGCVLGLADLTACHRAEDIFERVARCDYISGHYAQGRFGFALDNVRPLIDPLPLKSRQTPFWSWQPPYDLTKRLRPAVDHAAMAALWEARDAG